MDRWRRVGSERVARCRVFDVDRVRCDISPGRIEPAPAAEPHERDYFVIAAPDWINVIPVTPENRVVMVRQYRVGIHDFTLEIPGGMCDPGEDPVATAARELREETGYAAAGMISLGAVHPNPAIQDNRCHTFLAAGARRVGPQQPDGDEQIVVEEVDLASVPGLIVEGRITHSLVVAAFYLLDRRDANAD